jgi:hypothetical protein
MNSENISFTRNTRSTPLLFERLLFYEFASRHNLIILQGTSTFPKGNIMFSIASNTAARRMEMSALRSACVISIQKPVNRTLGGWSHQHPKIFKSGRSLLFNVTPSRRYLPLLGAATVGVAVGHHYYGNEKNFYDYRFIVDAEPDDLADFYGSENFMVCLSTPFVE